MAPALLLTFIVSVPALITVLLRSDAAVVLLSLTAGDLLVKYVGSDASDALSRATGNDTSGWAYVGLLLLPAILSIIALRKSVSSIKLPINLVTAVAAGLVGVLLVVPLLPPNLSQELTNNFLWNRLDQYRTGIIAGGIGVALVALWLGGHKSGHRKRHHKG